MTTVLIADDQTDARQALRRIVGRLDGFDVIGEAVDGLDAVGQVERRRPNLVLMDIRMPRLDGLEATRRITALKDPPAVVVLTTFDEDTHVFGALQAGAAGFLLKTATVDDLAAALRTVASGNGLIAPEVTRRLINRFGQLAPARAADPRLALLTPREREVLQLVARGSSNQQIAATLVIGETTVKTHVGRVLAKLGVISRAQAVVFAYEAGLVHPGQPADTAASDAREPHEPASSR